jgi:hypothetical protein
MEGPAGRKEKEKEKAFKLGVSPQIDFPSPAALPNLAPRPPARVLVFRPGGPLGAGGAGKTPRNREKLLVLTFLRLMTAALIVASASGAAAGEFVKSPAARPKAVVELFTSQGCGFCPPADALLADLARSDDVVALAYHVDYWDYLGWRDTMASPENTARQQEYSRAFATRSVFTPQAVVNGRVEMNGAKRARVEAAMRRMAGSPEGMIVETGAADRPVRNAQVLVVYFEPATPVRIGRGKNAGRELTYWNAVSGFHSAGMWHGEKTRIALPKNEIARKGAGGCAVLVQEMDEDNLPGAILGAAILSRPGS